MIRISCVAYAVEESASEEKTARPTALPMAWCGASAVESGRPISHARQLEVRCASESRWIRAAEAPGRTKAEGCIGFGDLPSSPVLYQESREGVKNR